MSAAGFGLIARVVGAIASAAAIYVIGSGNAEFTLATGFAANGFSEQWPGGYSLSPRRSSPKCCSPFSPC